MIDWAHLIQLMLAASILLLVAGLGMRVTFAEATSFFRHFLQAPYSLARAIFAMNIVVPLIAASVTLAFGLYLPVKIAIEAASISPVPPILPGKQVKFGGSASYVFGLLVSVSLAAILVVPVSVELLGKLFHRDVHMSFVQMLGLMGKTILLPLGAGMVIRQLAPGLAARTAPWVARTGNILLIAALLPLIGASLPGMWELIGNGTVLAIVVVVGVSITAGHLIGGPSDHDRTALGIVAAMRHPGVALAIGKVNFPDEKLLPAAILLYTLVAAIATTLYGKVRLRALSTGSDAMDAVSAGEQ